MLNKNKTITLWIGILTALLLIIGYFFHSVDTLASNNLIGWFISNVSVEHVVAISSTFIKSLHSLGM